MQKPKGSIRTAVVNVQLILRKSYRDNIPALAGQSAFFIILSVVPLLLFAFTVVSLITGKDLQNTLLSGQMLDNISDPATREIVHFITESISKAGSGTAIITAVVTLWSAGRGFYCITEGISRVYQLPNRRLWLVKRVLAMGYTVVMLIVFAMGLFVATFVIYFTDLIYNALGNTQAVFIAGLVLGYLLISLLEALVMALALKFYLLRKVSDRRYCKLRALFPGMILTVIAWNVLTVGVIIYLRHFATSSIYGSLSGIFIMMTWVYFMMYILLYGIEYNYIFHGRFSEKIKESIENT